MSSPRWVVVDDSDPSIHYTGAWFESQPNTIDTLGNFGTTYFGISHGTNATASLSYSFQGSAIDVFGTSNTTNSSGTIDPSWNCFIDGVSIGATAPSPSAENNWPLCTWNGTAGSHVLTLNANSSGPSFWFDWLRYQPPSSTSLQNAAVYLDPQDAAIKYDSSWQALGDTANMTTKQGSTATLDFIGTRLNWYGFIPTELPHGSSLASFTVDGQTVPTNFTLAGLSKANWSSVYNQRFFRTPVLNSSGPHELVVTFHGDQSSTPLTMSYLLIQNGSLSVSAPYTTSSSSASSKSTGIASSHSPSSTHVSIGPIIGGILGGLALLCLLFVIYYRKRRRPPVLSEPVEEPVVQPFHVPSSPTLPQHNNGYSLPKGTNNKHSTPASQPSVQSYDPPSDATSSSSGPSSQAASRKQMEATSSIPTTATMTQVSSVDAPVRGPQTTYSEGTSGSRARVVLHQDSGIRLPAQEEEEVVEVPPLYTPG